MSAYATEDRIVKAGKYPLHIEKFYCDEHGALLNDDAVCISTSDTGAPQWHRPDVVDVRRRMVRR